jgi:menaquinone-dependent protoporphyrinogen oxidase
MSTILVVCHTSEGQTARVADHVVAVLQSLGDEVEVHDVAGAPAPEYYDGVVVGDSVHAVHHSRALTRYLRDHVAVLNKLPAALFEVWLGPPDPHLPGPGAEALVRELFERTGFDPDLVGLFAGSLVYTKYGWLQRRVVRAISRRAGDEIDLRHDHEYTDWQAVEQFARDVHVLVQASAVATS